jgi:hypothetical protein
VLNFNPIEMTPSTGGQQVPVGKDLIIAKITSIDNASRSTCTSFPSVNVTGTVAAIASQYNQPLLESNVNPTNNRILSNKNLS